VSLTYPKDRLVPLAVRRTAVLLLAAAVSISVGDLALGAAQIARRLARTPVEPLLASALLGALVVTVADLAARRVLAPVELPVGVFTAAVGAPYLLWLLVRAEGVR
jgi:iron complex transport system permease protein